MIYLEMESSGLTSILFSEVRGNCATPYKSEEYGPVVGPGAAQARRVYLDAPLCGYTLVSASPIVAWRINGLSVNGLSVNVIYYFRKKIAAPK